MMMTFSYGPLTRGKFCDGVRKVAQIDRSVYAQKKQPRGRTATCYSSAHNLVAAGYAETGVTSATVWVS